MSRSSPEGIVLGKGSTLISTKLSINDKVVLDLKQPKVTYSEEKVLKLINLMLSEIEIRKNNIISNKNKMTIHLLEGGCIAFDSSQDVIKEQFEKFKK